jgi:hypothetical protein
MSPLVSLLCAVILFCVFTFVTVAETMGSRDKIETFSLEFFIHYGARVGQVASVCWAALTIVNSRRPK